MAPADTRLDWMALGEGTPEPMVAEEPDRARPGRWVLAILALAGAVAGGYLVRILMSEREVNQGG
jgi:hypothetical protein